MSEMSIGVIEAELQESAMNSEHGMTRCNIMREKVRLYGGTNFLSGTLTSGLNLDMRLYLGVGNSVSKGTEARKSLIRLRNNRLCSLV